MLVCLRIPLIVACPDAKETLLSPKSCSLGFMVAKGEMWQASSALATLLNDGVRASGVRPRVSVMSSFESRGTPFDAEPFDPCKR